jgi:hypothetical protein
MSFRSGAATDIRDINMRHHSSAHAEHHKKVASHAAEFYAAAGGSPRKWIQGAINPKNKGALHRSLHVPAGQKIPSGKLRAAAHSKNPLMAKRANLAMTLSKFPRHTGPRKGSLA